MTKNLLQYYRQNDTKNNFYSGAFTRFTHFQGPQRSAHRQLLRACRRALYVGTILLLAFAFLPNAAKANNIQVTNGSLTGQNTDEGYWMVKFDLSWENSWRTGNIFPDDGHSTGNWDAAWVFVKYRIGNGLWKHAKLNNFGHSAGNGTPAMLEIGVPNERQPFHITDNPGVGAFIYRNQNGEGTFSSDGFQLRWNYGADGVPHEADMEFKIIAIEMVFTAPGPFFLGTGGNESSSFYAGATTNEPFLATDSWNGCIGNTSGCLWGKAFTGTPGELHQHYPTGTEGFYSMKYQVSQQQYVDFLNTLTVTQASRRSIIGGNRNGINYTDSGFITSNPFVANNFMNWIDGAAYLDWAGLRPMTELEYEKAARGPANPVLNEMAWGNTLVIRATGLINAGAANELPTPETANVNYNEGNNLINGPLRVGSFAQSGNTREQSGAGYWGIMELSGNLWERPVTIANASGRSFTGLHGDGTITIDGYGDVEAWPGITEIGITGAAGSGFRGGSWAYLLEGIQVSSRLFADYAGNDRANDRGFRGVRSLPVSGIYGR